MERLYIKHADENIEAYKKERSIAEKQLELLNRTPDDFRITTETDLFGNKKETHYNFTETKRKELTLRIKKLSLEIEKGSVYSR
ncbi:hypothetical protein, partial [Streptomyces sp. P17]|uniref:hypothetical protein n=1 Tax=Streptomyces sp. P17 TaxID=3074716 RepID=UPI0028F434B2